MIRNIRKGLLGMLLVYASAFTQGWAQTHEIGFQGGIANYRGEMSSFINIDNPGPSFGIFYRANLGKGFSYRLTASMSRIQEDDANSDDAFALARDHRFETRIFQLGLRAEYNFLDFRQGRRGVTGTWTPYVSGGLAMIKLDPDLNLQPTYETFSAVIPLGVGFKTLLSPRLNFGAEFVTNFSFSDRLDDLGVDVNNTSVFSRNPKFFTGNPNDNDIYFTTVLSLSYVFPDPNIDCPVKF